MQEPKFESNAVATLQRVQSTFSQRGSEYSDTWKTCRFLNMKAVAREFGIEIPDAYYRALASAAFVDMKHERMSGGWKDDNAVDGIAYLAFLAEEMGQLTKKQHESPARNCSGHSQEVSECRHQNAGTDCL